MSSQITVSNPGLLIESNHDFAEILQNTITGQRQLHATRAYQPGDIICSFYGGQLCKTPTYLTVQIGVDEHITLQPEFLQYINHSCAPNVFFDTTAMHIVCLQAIEQGDEFTFFYPSTEWNMVQPFRCHCGSIQCLGEIKGAAYLSNDAIKKYRLTNFIQQQLNERSSGKARA